MMIFSFIFGYFLIQIKGIFEVNAAVQEAVRKISTAFQTQFSWEVCNKNAGSDALKSKKTERFNRPLKNVFLFFSIPSTSKKLARKEVDRSKI